MPALPSDARITLRALESRDLDELIPFLPDLLPGDWSAAGIGKLLESGHRFRVLVLHDKLSDIGGNDALAGFAEYQCILDEGHLLGIAVAPHAQRKGVGGRLLADVLALLRSEGCTRCLLEVRKSNVAAQALYQRAGFTLDGVRKNYYPPKDAGHASEDALLYSCELQSPPRREI
jgi:ribosomal-protein-alanine N-acetyltransferase